MIKNIVFDIGNVLAGFRWQELLRDDLGVTGDAFEYVANATVRDDEMWGEFDRSELSDKEIVESCVIKAPEYEAEIRSMFAHIRDIVEEYPYAADWIRDLKKRGFQVYLLSNYGRTAFEAAEDKLSFLSAVDGKIISYEVKSVKPEPEIYRALLEKYHLKAEECLFFDDREKNVEAAKKEGFQAAVFTSKDQAEEEIQARISTAPI